MKRYTARQVRRALAQEQLLHRLDRGEYLEDLGQELGLSLSQKRENLALTQQELVALFGSEFQESISQSCVSDILRKEGVAIPGGQHYRSQEERALPVERAGVFFPSGRRPPDGRAEHGDPGDPGAERRLPGA